MPPTARSQRSAKLLNYAPRGRPVQVSSESRPPRGIPYFKQRRLPLLFGFATGIGIVFYCTVVYRSYKKDIAMSATLDIPEDVSDRYQQLASRFDSEVSNMEWWMGIDRRRKELCAKAKGHVLEVSAGTGRNSKYLPLTRGIKSVTLADKNEEMIYEARRKWPEDGNAWFIRTSFHVQDCKEKVPCPAPEGFDTILQTMGICSVSDPVALLQNLAEMANQKDGRILLLEHGKSSYEWLNNIMDGMAPAHANRFGCWFNKDIGAIVESSGLEVVESKRFNFGTTWWFELKPKAQRRTNRDDKEEKPQIHQPSWSSWLRLTSG